MNTEDNTVYQKRPDARFVCNLCCANTRLRPYNEEYIIAECPHMIVWMKNGMVVHAETLGVRS